MADIPRLEKDPKLLAPRKKKSSGLTSKLLLLGGGALTALGFIGAKPAVATFEPEKTAISAPAPSSLKSLMAGLLFCSHPKAALR